VYGPKLVLNDFSTYNISRLAELADFIFVMGYDMSWNTAKMGTGALEAGPNAPLDSLKVGLLNALKTGIPPSSLVLGLPFYGRLYACDGKSPPKFGNCSCAEKVSSE
jgi:spore germination protein YaaH